MGKGFLSWFKPQIYNILFSSRHGLISWTPLILLSIIGVFFFMVKSDRIIGSLILLILVFQVYVNSIVDDWWAGYSFGARRFVNCTVFFALGLAGLIDYIKKKFKLIYIVVPLILIIVWTQLFIKQYKDYYFPMDGEISLRQKLSNDLLVIKRILNR